MGNTLYFEGYVMKKLVYLLLAVAMLFLFGLAALTNACEEECDPSVKQLDRLY